MDSLKGTVQSLPPPMISVIVVSLFLMLTFILRFTVKDRSSDSYAKVMILEMIATAELMGCWTEIPPGDALADAVHAIFFIFAWVALLMWFDNQWTYGERANPCIQLEDLVQDRRSLSTVAVIFWMEFGGALAGYRFMGLLSSSLKGDVGCANPLTVSVWEGMLFQCLGALVIRVTALCYPKESHRNYVYINYFVTITARLAGAKSTGSAYNPMQVTGMYYFCQEIMPLTDFLAVNWVAPMAASMMAVVIAPPVHKLLNKMHLT